MLDDMSMSLVLSGLILGSIGFGIFLWGKKQQELVPILVGLALSILPMCIHSVALLWILSGGVLGGWKLLHKFAG